ncbi:hypothetical protein [Magnetovibrio blakemorei]|uniref:Uncharacterized protein n=1 Tax=Magnetovibrio blakemorei TaxID=28181 RepID=A0A1E5Q2V0_9PROT|nr:hypothetical protein [Magnetovibrio blakemorei]OEJ63791.1 hypothetical protein BEN30_17290 [Magnetovibrio blakemorei]
MSIVYDFGSIRAASLLKGFTKQAHDVALTVSSLTEIHASIQRRLDITNQHLGNAISKYEDVLESVHDSQKFIKKCAKACELEDIEKMIQERNRLAKKIPLRSTLFERD